MEPRLINRRPASETEIQDYFLAYFQGQPAYVYMKGLSDIFLPLFSSFALLKTTLKICNVEYDRVVTITDQAEFLASIPPRLPCGTRLRIIIDPSQIDEGNSQFKEIIRKEVLQ